ncbi:unnamed protein product [Clonostachys byssicola]|uniref:Uncharacterized protein n=1 Tax=Clonostachys byssicola TaxID=160290 RepID=A0A9N9YDF2_9HYPO|nr:unnamed protein product [Clonostachys byssicola]
MKKCACQNNKLSGIPMALWVVLLLSILILGICLVGGLTTTLLDGSYGLSLAMVALIVGCVIYVYRVAKEYLEYREMAARLVRQTCECGGANENTSRAHLSKGPLSDPDKIRKSGVQLSNHGPTQDLDSKV